jgi:hypothetical protein
MKDKFPILVVDELLDKLKQVCFFSKPDIHYDYHHVLRTSPR